MQDIGLGLEQASALFKRLIPTPFARTLGRAEGPPMTRKWR